MGTLLIKHMRLTDNTIIITSCTINTFISRFSESFSIMVGLQFVEKSDKHKHNWEIRGAASVIHVGT